MTRVEALHPRFGRRRHLIAHSVPSSCAGLGWSLALLGLLSACATGGRSGPMRYAASGPLPGWTKVTDSLLTTVLQGAEIEVRFSEASTRVVVTVENRSGHAVEVRMGAEGTSRDVQIGEFLQRPIESAPGVVGSDYRPYSTWMPWSVPTGSRATFHLDSPLGRAPSYGQFFVFTVEARRPTGPIERRSIQVNARHVDADARR